MAWVAHIIVRYNTTVSMLFYRKRKRERHSNTVPYLHCGMVIFVVVIIINTWGIYYSEKFGELKAVPEMLTTSEDRRLLVKTKNTNPDSTAVVSYYLQAVKERSRETVMQLLRRASHHLPHFPWPRVSRYHNWRRVNYKPWILQFTLLWRHWTSPTATNGSLRQTITDTVQGRI